MAATILQQDNDKIMTKNVTKIAGTAQQACFIYSSVLITGFIG
jgi:hypothetical protein